MCARLLAGLPAPRVRARAREGGSDVGAAMMTVIMLIMIVGSLSVLLLGVIVAQVKPTMFADKNARTVFAAETGLDATLSQVRSAVGPTDPSGNAYGDPTKLPCSVQGAVGAAGTPLSYSVRVQYFDENPVGKDATWRAANAFPCVPGSGVSVAPGFAVLSSEGLDAGVAGMATASGNRRLETIYTFQISNNNIDGGTIYAFGAKHCLQATGQTAGSKVLYVDAAQCGSDDPRQLWSYAKDYTIHLSVTDLGGAGSALCMTGNASTGGNIDVTLTPCSASNTAQKFSWEGGARWRGQQTSNAGYSGSCLGATAVYTDAALIGKPLKYGTCGGDNSTSGSFDPDPRVGAGAAGKSTLQVVNFLEFGRCLDVTDEDVTKSFMISYPCKQDPSGGSQLKWNHKWNYSEPMSLKGSLGGQQVVVKNGSTTRGVNGANYCMTTAGATASPGYITMTQCTAGNLDQSWTRHAERATYAESWTFTDRYGRCLSLGEKMPATTWSKITVAPCSGGTEQKWNAPPVSQEARLDDYKELAN